jgi:hypothetical protein
MGLKRYKPGSVYGGVLWSYLAAVGHQARLAVALRPWWG